MGKVTAPDPGDVSADHGRAALLPPLVQTYPAVDRLRSPRRGRSTSHAEGIAQVSAVRFGCESAHSTPCAPGTVWAMPFLFAPLYDTIEQLIPIMCVDLIPVHRDANGQVSEVGLVLRDSPLGEVVSTQRARAG